MSPRANPLVMLWLLLRHGRGQITLAEVGERVQFRENEDLSGSYMGYAMRGGV